MTKLYVGISALIFALVAIVHIARLVQGWEVQVGGTGVSMFVSWAAVVVSAVLAVWGGILLRR